MKTKRRPPSPATRRRRQRLRTVGFGSQAREGARLSVLTGLFVAFVFFDVGSSDPFMTVKLVALWIFGVAAVGLWSVDIIRGHEHFPRLRLVYVAGAFLFALALATTLSVNPVVSMLGIQTRYGGFLSYLLYGAIFLVLADLYRRRPERLRELLGVLVAAGVVVAGYVLVQAAGVDPIPWEDPLGRELRLPIGNLGNSNFSAGFLAMVLPAVGYFFLAARSRDGRGFFAGVGALVAAALWFTQGRGGMVAALVGVAVLVVLLGHRFPGWTRIVLLAGLGGALVVGGVFLTRMVVEGMDQPLGELELRERTVVQRAETYAGAVEIFLDHPITGTGPETFHEVYPRYRSVRDAAHHGLTPQDKPHNVVLEHAATAGVLGVGAFLALLAAALWWGIRRLKTLQEPRRLLLGGFLAILVTYLVQASFSVDVPPLAVVGWLALAGIAALADPGSGAGLSVTKGKETPTKGKETPTKGKETPTKGKETPPGRRHPALVAVALTLVGALGLVLVVAGARPYQAARSAAEASAAEMEGLEVDAVVAHYERAIDLYPFESVYRTNLGLYLERQARELDVGPERQRLLEEALERHGSALDLRPGNIIYRSNVARATTQLAADGETERFEQAERAWTRAVSHDPNNWQVHRRFATMLRAQAAAGVGDAVALYCRAFEHLRRAEQIRDDAPDVLRDLETVRERLEPVGGEAVCS